MFGLERHQARFATAGPPIVLVWDAYDCYDLQASVIVAGLQPFTTHALLRPS